MRAGVLLLAVGVASGTAFAVDEMGFSQVRQSAAIAILEGRSEAAYADLKKLHAWAPDVETVCFDAARMAAQLGRTDESFAWLDKAIASGYANLERAYGASELGELRGDPRWQPAIDRMSANRDAEAASMLARRPDRDPSTAPAFRSYKKLDAHYDEEHMKLHREGWKMSRRSMGEAALALVDERVAATRRYLAEHPEAKDRDAAAWGVVRGRVTLRQPYRLQERWGEAGKQTIEELNTFLAENPASPYRGDALILRAFARFHVRPEGGTRGRPWNEEDLAALVASLGEAARTNRGSTGAGQALAWQLVVANGAAPLEITPEMVAMHGELTTIYARNRDVQAILETAGRGAMMRFKELDAFEGTDIAGGRWGPERFRGKVTLIDFWAGWCVPCMNELPTLRAIWNDLRPSGLQVVGVSLDSVSQKNFEKWLVDNDIRWPQIYDGRGFETPLARKFGVRSIPFTMVIGPDGKVAAANLRGEQLVETLRAMLD